MDDEKNAAPVPVPSWALRTVIDHLHDTADGNPAYAVIGPAVDALWKAYRQSNPAPPEGDGIPF